MYNRVNAGNVEERRSSSFPSRSIDLTFFQPYRVSEVSLGNEITDEKEGHGNSFSSSEKGPNIIFSSLDLVPGTNTNSEREGHLTIIRY